MEEEEQEQELDLPKWKRKELGLSCMLNLEVGAVLAVLRRSAEAEEPADPRLVHSLKSLRGAAFSATQQWRAVEPATYLSPFLEVVTSDNVPAAATGVALSAILKTLKLEVFDVESPGARRAVTAVVEAVTGCRLEKTDPASEDAVMLKILLVLCQLMHHPASSLMSDHSVCLLLNTCFQIVQQSLGRGDLLQRNARYATHELIQIVFSRMPEFEEEGAEREEGESGYGIGCVTDIFRFLCSLFNGVELLEGEGTAAADEDVQLFALILITTAIELSGDAMGRHPKLLALVQDDLFHHLIHYGTFCSPLVFSMICSTVLNTYHFLRRYLRHQLEAFFVFVLLRISGATQNVPIQLQEVSLEAIINFCRQPTFMVEAYANYDCDPLCKNVFEDIGKLLCRHSYPTGSTLTSLKVQAFEGLMTVVHTIADNVDRADDPTPSGPYPVPITELSPFWDDEPKDMTRVELLRLRRVQKKKLLVAAYHFNRDEKKGLEYLKFSKLAPDPPDPRAFAFFFRYTPGLDKSMLGDYLGDPDEFNLRVLKEFTEFFEFSGMVLDTALRTYLETFRLPGESQKIQRILEAFSDRFYEQQNAAENIFECKDVVFILCYSLIMLNTDQHNPQVKKKMTEEEFIRNNRAINGGRDLPKEYLLELFSSISNNAISIFGQQSGQGQEMNSTRWVQLMNRSRRGRGRGFEGGAGFDRRLGRDMFSCIAGPAVASLCAFFEAAEEEELLHECVEGSFSVARIAGLGLEETLDELLASFCKFTTLLNPYASPDETLFAFSHDVKPKIATLTVFSLAASHGASIRAGWKNLVDCLLKLRRLKLLPHSLLDFDDPPPEEHRKKTKIIFGVRSRQGSRVIGRFSRFLDPAADPLSLCVSEFEQNLKIIRHCRIGSVFRNTPSLPEDSLINLGRALIFSAAGKGQKFSSPAEEEETVTFCWDLFFGITMSNLERFNAFWSPLHEHLILVANFPALSPALFAERAIVGLFKVCLTLLSTYPPDKYTEELIFKSINLIWKLDKEVFETCSDTITTSVNKILSEYPASMKSQLAWKSVLHLLSIIGRHPDTYEQAVESLITLISDGTHLSWINYAYCVDAAFSFVALRNSPLDKNIKILDLLSDSVTKLIMWYKTQSSNSPDDSPSNKQAFGYSVNLFLKLGEALRKTSLARREEIRNHAVEALRRSFELAENLELTSSSVLNCFNQVIFAMVDDLHEKMLEYSRRDGAERETRSMEGTLKLAMDLLTEVFSRFMRLISYSPGFRTFWLGVLRRMDTYMKADLGEYGKSRLQGSVPDMLRRIITEMKDMDILAKKEGDDLWEITYIQIQWIAPTIKDELFPGEALG